MFSLTSLDSNRAIDEGYLEENVAAAYMRRRKRGMSRYQRKGRQSPRRKALLPAEIEDLIEHIKEEDAANPRAEWAYTIDAFRFAVATGLRRKEVCYLNRRDVTVQSLKGRPVTGQLSVRCWDNKASGEKFHTKTGDDRTVPLTPLAAEIAWRHLERHRGTGDWEPLFQKPTSAYHSSSGRLRRMAPDTISALFMRFRNGLGWTDRVVLHSLRHTYLSWLVMLRVDPYLIMEIAGHSDLHVQSKYIHVANEYLQGARVSSSARSCRSCALASISGGWARCCRLRRAGLGGGTTGAVPSRLRTFSSAGSSTARRVLQGGENLRKIGQMRKVCVMENRGKKAAPISPWEKEPYGDGI